MAGLPQGRVAAAHAAAVAAAPGDAAPRPECMGRFASIARMPTQNDVRRICSSLPEAVESKSEFSFRANGRLFVWAWLERIDPKKARAQETFRTGVGSLMTVPFEVTGTNVRVEVNAELASDGQITVELLDRNGMAVPRLLYTSIAACST